MDFVELVILKTFLQDSSSESNSDSDTDTDDLVIEILEREKVKKARIEKYVYDVVPKYSDIDFQSHFRLTRPAFEDLLQVLTKNVKSSKKPILHREALLLTLWTLSNQESFRGVGDRFSMTKGEAYVMFRRTCMALYALRDKYIVWPRNEEATTNTNEFNILEGTYSFPNIFGCVDGCHIAITGPKNDNSYYNRKGFHSVLLQGICDSRLRFIDVFCGWPGSSHKALMWQNSPIYQKFIDGCDNYLPQGCHILGDGAYPLREFIMVPFIDNGHLTAQQKEYNVVLNRTRTRIGQAFGSLKESFQRLKFLHLQKIAMAKYIITSACILHNICINYEISTDFKQDTIIDSDDHEDIIDDRPDQASIQKRNNIMHFLDIQRDL